MNAPERATLSQLYNNRELVPEHPQFMARWSESSARARASMTGYLDRAYGEQPGETIDLFPARKGDGSCLMFIHGGYWRSLDKKDFSFLAPWSTTIYARASAWKRSCARCCARAAGCG
jgi:arylformamidase